MLLSFGELVDIVIMSLVVGFIFSDLFARFHKPKTVHYDPLKDPLPTQSLFNWDNIKFAAIVTAPAIILHELGHKFVAMAFGVSAMFHAAYTWLALGVVLKLMNFGFIFFVPGYVQIQCLSSGCNITPLQSAIIAFAGPGVNLALWLGCAALFKSKSFQKNHRKYLPVAFLSSKINMFLFFFNMNPF